MSGLNTALKFLAKGGQCESGPHSGEAKAELPKIRLAHLLIPLRLL